MKQSNRNKLIEQRTSLIKKLRIFQRYSTPEAKKGAEVTQKTIDLINKFLGE